MLRAAPNQASVVRAVRELLMRSSDLLELQLLHAWLKHAQIGYLALDDEFLVVSANEQSGRLLGVDSARLINRSVQNALAHCVRLDTINDWVRSAAAGSTAHARVRLPGHGSDTIMRLTRDAAQANGKNYVVLAITDVTESVTQQTELEATRRQWQALNAGVVVVDATQPDLPIVFVNATFEDMTGYSAAETLGRNCRFLQGPDGQQPGLDAIRRALLAKVNGYAVLRNYRKDGSLFYNELFISPVRNEAGIVTHFVGIQHLRDERFKDVPAQVGDHVTAGYHGLPLGPSAA
jgi:PAS domain S-box-containing protein